MTFHTQPFFKKQQLCFGISKHSFRIMPFGPVPSISSVYVHVCVCVCERERELWFSLSLALLPRQKDLQAKKTDGITQYRLGGEKRESSGLHRDFRRFSQR